MISNYIQIHLNLCPFTFYWISYTFFLLLFYLLFCFVSSSSKILLLFFLNLYLIYLFLWCFLLVTKLFITFSAFYDLLCCHMHLQVAFLVETTTTEFTGEILRILFFTQMVYEQIFCSKVFKAQSAFTSSWMHWINVSLNSSTGLDSEAVSFKEKSWHFNFFLSFLLDYWAC